MGYAELQCRTHYSFLRGASHPSELVDRAAELGLAALAVTDRDGVYGIPKAYVAAKPHSGLKLVVGAELTLAAGLPRLTLLARDRAGYGLMCRLLTASHAGKPKGEAALGWAEFLREMTGPGVAGLIALPEVPTCFGAEVKVTPPEVAAGLRALFGGGRLWVPVSRFLDGWDDAREAWARAQARELGAPLVAVNDVHYHVPERCRLQDVLAATRENVPLAQAGSRVFSNAERYLKSPAQMRELFADLPEAIEATLQIAAMCSFSPAELRYYYPSEWIPAGETAQGYLERLTWEGSHRRYDGAIPTEVEKQLRHELGLITQLGFADYFLTIWEIVQFARSRGILCQGRGSAANSAVCYCLGITAIDPVRMNLLFERFISVERGEPPDIDVDFEHERREEVIQHIYEKYGRHRAGMVAALITYRSRSAARDVGKALGLSVIDRKAPPAVAAELMTEIRAFPRHLSIHSGGFTLSAEPIIETVPIEPARMPGRTIVQWDKDDLAAIGLLKVDVLALGMLSAIRKALEAVYPGADPQDAMARIPPDDPETYAMIQRGQTVGVFQIESRAQISMLRRLLPASFYDLVVEVAIVRPGPIVGQMVHPYLKRRRGEESPKSPHPDLEPILGRTLGVPLFQEQVMKMAVKFADFTPGQADELRRAIGAWRSSGTIEKLGQKLKAGLLKKGLPSEFVERVFKQIQGFAEYGFPESHAASFALLAYVSSYLKRHHPAEFTCALINSQPMGFYSSHTLVEEAKRQGVEVRPVDPRYSEWNCTLEGRALRIGWCVVNGMSGAEGRRVTEARTERPFGGLADFVARTRVSSRVLHRLAQGGAFECFGRTPRQALWDVLGFQATDGLFAGVEHSATEVTSAPKCQLSLFEPLSDFETIQSDYESFGLSTRGHPMRALRSRFAHDKKFPSATTTGFVKRVPAGRGIRLAGLLIVRQRPSTAKGTVFATLEDEEGFLDLILHKETYERLRDVFVENPFLIVSGRVQRDPKGVDAVSVLVRGAQALIPADTVRVASHDFR